MGIVIKGRAAAALLKAEGGSSESFLNLVKPQASILATQTVMPSELSAESAPTDNTPASSARPAANFGLQIRLLDQTKWISREIPTNIEMVTIGSDPRQSDICLSKADAEPTQVTLRRLNDVWYAIESARVGKMRVNGVKRPQTTLKRGEFCSLGIGARNMLVLSPQQADGKSSFDSAKDYVVRAQGGPFKHLLEEPLLIGSDPECRVRIKEGPAFAGVVFHLEGRLLLHSLQGGADALSVDGASADETPRPLKHLSTITLGGKELCLLEFPEELKSAPIPPGLPEYNDGLMFIETNGPFAGRKFQLPGAGRSFMAGRAPDNMLVVDSLKVSRHHAQITVYDNAAMITDEGSANGSFVGGEKITRRVLRPGERVIFADRAFMLCHSC